MVEVDKREYVFNEMKRMVEAFEPTHRENSYQDIEKLLTFIWDNFSIEGVNQKDFQTYVMDRRNSRFDYQIFLTLPEHCVLFYILRYMLANVRMTFSSSMPIVKQIFSNETIKNAILL